MDASAWMQVHVCKCMGVCRLISKRDAHDQQNRACRKNCEIGAIGGKGCITYYFVLKRDAHDQVNPEHVEQLCGTSAIMGQGASRMSLY